MKHLEKGMSTISKEAREMYATRNANLSTLGFPSYKAYLKSSTWAKIKQTLLDTSIPCVACGRRAATYHHNRYEIDDLTGFCRDNLIPVCMGCHKSAEFNRKGNKIGPKQATGKLEQLKAEHAVKAQKRDGWRFLFDAIENARVYLGMQDDPEAQAIAHTLDEALDVVRHLPKKK